MKAKISTLFLVVFMLLALNMQAGTVTVGATGTYASISAAITGLGTITEPTIIELTADYAQTSDEITAIAGADATNTVTIRPQAALTITGNGAFVWKMNGCQYVTIDGRVGGSGSAVLTLKADTVVGNSLTTALKNTIALQFVNDAAHNTVKYVNLKGATTVNPWRSTTSTAAADRGTITFGAGIATGNSYNIIDNCDLGPVHAYTGTPTVAIYSVGTSGFPNTNLTISNCNIYDYFPTDYNKATTAPLSGVGVYLGANTTACTVSGNSFYQTQPRAKIYSPSTVEMWGNGTGARTAAIVVNNTSGSGFIVKNNYIGGSQAECGGSVYKVVTGNGTAFNGILMNVSPTATSYIYGNTIKNLYLGSSANQGTAQQTSAINFNGAVYVGIREDGTTAEGNIIGDQSATTVGANASITFWNSAGSVFTGIVCNTATNATVKIANNKIAGIYIPSNLTIIHYLMGINVMGSNLSNITIENNEIGNNAVGAAAADMSLQNFTGRPIYGINLTAANTGSTITISNNKINNFYSYNGSTNASGDPSQAFGVWVTNSIGCPVTINNNEIRDFVYYSKRSGNTGDAFTTSSGIMCASYGNGSVIRDNKIYNIHGIGANSYNTNGISLQCFNASTTVKMNIYNNLIYNLSQESTSAIGTRISGVTGINTACSGTAAGTTVYTPVYNVYNNIIRLGSNRDGSAITLPISLVGIRDTMISSSASATANYYNNTIYISGTGVTNAVSNPSFGMCFATYNNEATPAAVASVVTRNVKNNIIINTRTNETTGGGHYAIGTGGSSTALANFTSNKNDFYVNASGPIGRFTSKTDATDMAALRTATAGDAGSINILPVFASATDLHLSQTTYANSALNIGDAVTINTVVLATDFDGDSRAGFPTLGADEYTGPGTATPTTDRSDIFVSVTGRQAVVNGTEAGQTISVYNAGGQLVKQLVARGQQTALNLNAGIYIVKANNQVMKVVL